MTIVPLTLVCLSHMFKEQLQGAGVFSSYRSFLESNSTFLGFVLSVPMVPKEVARWPTDERIAMVLGRCDKARSLIRLSSITAQEAQSHIRRIIAVARQPLSRKWSFSRSHVGIHTVRLLDHIVPFGGLRIDVSQAEREFGRVWVG
jgi:hypothetical protein